MGYLIADEGHDPEALRRLLCKTGAIADLADHVAPSGARRDLPG
jgi:hypothetical protein